ncbi:hypothetical protein BGX30_002732 [Mortierella sp. GBA39]|nr:hypothetical protein BGX30_002732 [Mortierella sp. GBA39]
MSSFRFGEVESGFDVVRKRAFSRFTKRLFQLRTPLRPPDIGSQQQMPRAQPFIFCDEPKENLVDIGNFRHGHLRCGHLQVDRQHAGFPLHLADRQRQGKAVQRIHDIRIVERPARLGMKRGQSPAFPGKCMLRMIQRRQDEDRAQRNGKHQARNEKSFQVQPSHRHTVAFETSVFRPHFGFAANFDGGGMVRKLGDQHFAFVQLLRVMKPGILASGQSNDLHPLILRLDHDKIAVPRIPFIFHEFQGVENMQYEPAPLREGQISKLREYEQQLSQLTGSPVILIAYSEKDDNGNPLEGHISPNPTEKKRP